MRVLLVALLTMASAVIPIAADTPSVNGKWQVHQSIAGNESDLACTFTQDGTALSGACASDQSTGKLTGNLAANKVSWAYKTEYNGSPLTLTYTGTLDASRKIAGTVRVEEYSVDGEFTATPAK